MTEYVGWYGCQRRQDWGTPLDLFSVLNQEYRFDLDGASDGDNGLLPESSTPEHPIPWAARRVFCNPPWSAIPPFVEMAPDSDLAVLLVPARTNARWFHRALELGARVRFFPGRPSFRHVGAHRGHNSPIDCVLLVFGSAVKEAAA